ncbi:BnaAnng34000D [Brassica napus]|uniref:BnaAnng34000D protein n=3 Tax=Brassica TaxID=3705 RepID=A0A078JUN0_BRANA|nr:BnaAnng34000D [Brassica napus]
MFFYGFKPVKTGIPLLNVFRRGIMELMYKVQMQFFEDAKLMRGGHYMNLMSSLKPPSSTGSINEPMQRACKPLSKA